MQFSLNDLLNDLSNGTLRELNPEELKTFMSYYQIATEGYKFAGYDREKKKVTLENETDKSKKIICGFSGKGEGKERESTFAFRAEGTFLASNGDPEFLHESSIKVTPGAAVGSSISEKDTYYKKLTFSRMVNTLQQKPVDGIVFETYTVNYNRASLEREYYDAATVTEVTPTLIEQRKAYTTLNGTDRGYGESFKEVVKKGTMGFPIAPDDHAIYKIDPSSSMGQNITYRYTIDRIDPNGEKKSIRDCDVTVEAMGAYETLMQVVNTTNLNWRMNNERVQQMGTEDILTSGMRAK
jgi:hypothetical protein